MNPKNGTPPKTIGDVDYRESVVASSARISKHAVVGATGEWRDRATRFAVHIDEDVIIREHAVVHAGCERPTVIGRGTLICSGAYVGHDTRIGEYCEITPNATISGCCTLGDRVRVGAGAVIRPHVTIGDDARIGAGAVVVRDIPAGETWVGNPARKLSKWKGATGDDALSELEAYHG